MNIINRTKEILEILEYIKYRKSVLITGKEGIGKTRILEELKNSIPNSIFTRGGPPKLILESICDYLQVKPTKRIADLLDTCRQELKGKELVLLIDDAEYLTKEACRIIKDLPITIVGAGKRDKQNIFDEEIKLDNLSHEANLKLAESELKEIERIPLGLIEDIVKQAKENPKRIVKICGIVGIACKNKEININDRNSVLNLLKKIRKKRKLSFNLISPWILMTMAYMFLIFRYAFYRVREFEIGYTMAMIGYLVIVVYRGIKYRKSKW